MARLFSSARAVPVRQRTNSFPVKSKIAAVQGRNEANGSSFRTSCFSTRKLSLCLTTRPAWPVGFGRDIGCSCNFVSQLGDTLMSDQGLNRRPSARPPTAFLPVYNRAILIYSRPTGQSHILRGTFFAVLRTLKAENPPGCNTRAGILHAKESIRPWFFQYAPDSVLHFSPCGIAGTGPQ